MSDAAKSVPAWARILVGLIALLNLGFGIMGYISPGAAGLPFAARNTAIGVAILLVSIVGVPESIAITMIIRALIEAQDFVIQIVQGGLQVSLLMPLAFFVAEALVIVTMFGIVVKRDKTA